MGSQELDLPEGPVTIMFTDVEGSTALRTSLGDTETDELLSRHDELIRTEIEAHKGWDQKAALGDGFLAVFASTRRALACAIAIQRALDSFNLERSGRPLRVRIGLNTGEVAAHDGQLTGEAVHAAARVCAAASGGQILVSDVTRQLAGTIPDVTFHDTGEHQLKGFPQPWRLFEVVWVRETTQLPHQVFVGRERELAALRAKLAAALDGRGSLVLVGGEPGVGKTTLVKQLIREAEQRGALAVFGRCYESEGTVPYSPFVEMLEQALAIMPPEIVREDMGADAAEVARLVPELRRRFPDIGEPLDLPPEQQRRYFFNAVGSFIARGAARFPLMLVMDDVHWADEPTLLLIEHMASLMPELRVFGVGTYRDVELDVSRPLAATLERMLRARTVERLPVKRFDLPGVATMIEALAGKVAPPAIVRAVFDETEGNPFFVEEVFRHLTEEGKIFDEHGDFRTDITVDELDVPESVRLVVGRRLERLGDEAQKVLAAGAVVGRAFAFSLLEEIADVDAGRLLDIVEEAEAARVIVPEERDGEVHYSFAHELIRQTLLSGISILRRQRLHLSVANAIERTDKLAREARPSEIAHHLLQAGAAAEEDRTLEYLELAADRAIDAAAFEEALRAIDDALSVVDGSGALAQAKLLERKAWTVRALGNYEESLTILDEVIDSYAALGEHEAAAELCRETAYMCLWLGRFEDVFAANQRGLNILGDRIVPARAYLVSGLGALLGVGGFRDQALTYINEADGIGDQLNDDRVIGWNSWTRCLTLHSNAEVHGAVEVGRQAIELLRGAGDLWMLCDSLAWTGLALNVSGFVDDALEVGTEALALSKRLGHRGGEILANRTVAAAEVFRDPDLDRWEDGVRRDLELCQSINSPWKTQSNVWLGIVLQQRGRLDEAHEQFAEARATEPVSAFAGIAEGYGMLTHAYAGDRDAFVTAFEHARPRLPGGPAATPWGSFVVVVSAVQGAAFLDVPEIAAEVRDFLPDAVARVPLGFFDGALAQRVYGMAEALAGRWDDAETHFVEARRQAAEFPCALDVPKIDHWHGKMLLDRGRPEDERRAREMVAAALESYRSSGMPILATMAEELLESARVR
jgi:class 3 adenylate cyclase/tetratricopeptide (TPR) repeat protein